MPEFHQEKGKAFCHGRAGTFSAYFSGAPIWSHRIGQDGQGRGKKYLFEMT